MRRNATVSKAKPKTKKQVVPNLMASAMFEGDFAKDVGLVKSKRKTTKRRNK